MEVVLDASAMIAYLRDEAGADIVTPLHRESAMGKYAHIQLSSDEFNRRKQEEIDLEDRRCR